MRPVAAAWRRHWAAVTARRRKRVQLLPPGRLAECARVGLGVGKRVRVRRAAAEGGTTGEAARAGAAAVRSGWQVCGVARVGRRGRR